MNATKSNAIIIACIVVEDVDIPILCRVADPWGRIGQGASDVDTCVGEQHVVVFHDPKHGNDLAEAKTGPTGMDNLEAIEGALTSVPAHNHLDEVGRYGNENQADQVRKNEGATTPLSDKVREAPQISDADRIA